MELVQFEKDGILMKGEIVKEKLGGKKVLIKYEVEHKTKYITKRINSLKKG